MKKFRVALIVAALLSLLITSAVFAQTEALTLKMSRDWGYGGLNGDIQGLFSMKVTGPEDLVRVVFYIDETSIGEATQAPFNLQFTTDDYATGIHEMSAVGYSSSGQEYRSNVISANFVSAGESAKMTGQIILPLLGVIFGALLLAALVPLLTGRKTRNLPSGAPRQYPMGGTICPKCGRPFAIHLFGLNLGVGKLDRCPYCGKWSVVRRVPMDALRAAEQAELEMEKPQVAEMSEEEKLKKELDDSKFQGM